MNKSTQVGLILAYFISKYDTSALQALNYKTFTEAYNDIESKLGITANYFKNMRDHFDPLHPWRTGWPVEELGPRHIKVIELFSNLSFPAFSSIARDILDGRHKDIEEIQIILTKFDETDKEIIARRPFIPRAITGTNAEKFFQTCFEEGILPFSGKIIDRRNEGCGYDFKIISDNEEYLIEVKGLAGITGGVSLTDKEWEVANEQPNYKLFIAFNLDTNDRDFKIIDSPAQVLKPTKVTRTTVQVSWNISTADLRLNDR